MDNAIIQFIADKHMFVVVGILVFFGLIETALGYYASSKRSKNDLMVEVVNTFFLMAITKPAVVFLTMSIMKWLAPAWEGVLSGLSFWVLLPMFLLVDDFLQYWYHRSSHEYKWLWKWHRAHHTATEMGLLVSYRESIYFYMLMPNVWWLGVFAFFGGAAPMAVGIVLKQAIVISSHSLVTWDSWFHKHQLPAPVLQVLERIFITPAFHHQHHAVSKVDGIGNPNGNYGNMFSFWDQLFGTAQFIHAFPAEYGIPNDPDDGWAAHCFYPLVKSDKPGSELAPDFRFDKTTVPEPAVLNLSPGDYLYCTCGYSRNQPFCDGSHHGTKFEPLKFSIRKEQEYRLCQCKQCAKGPFCDDSHLKVRGK